MIALNTDTVYLLDDDSSILKSTRRLLDSAGWKVEAFTDPIAFLERASTECPDVAVIDILMPEMNGLDAARQIVDLSPKTPILMVTIHLSKQLSEEARKVGIRGACAKGDIGCVVDAVDALLRHETYFQN